MRQVGDAAGEAARGTDGSFLGAIGMVIGVAITTAVRKVRGETIVEAIRKGNEGLRQTMSDEGAATRKTIHETGAKTQDMLHEISTKMAVLGERMDRMDRPR